MVSPHDDSPRPEATVLAAIERKWSPSGNHLRRVEVVTVPGESNVFVALFDTEPKWFGRFACFAVSDGAVTWVADIDQEPDAPAMESVAALRLPGFDHPIVEILSCTHMGNGSVYVYELRSRRLRLLLETRAVDWHSADGTVFRGGILNRSYSDVDGDGISDIVLEGLEDSVANDHVHGTREVHQVFLWNSNSGRFERSD